MQIGGGCLTRKHSSTYSSWIPCDFGEPTRCRWSSAHLLLFSEQEREAPVLVMCCHWATNYLSNICCPSKVGRSFNRPGGFRLQGRPLQASSAGTNVCSNRGSSTRISIVDLFGHNPASPPYTARKRLEQPPHQYRQGKQTPFVPPAPSQRRARYMIHPPPPAPQSWKLQNSPTFTFPPFASSVGAGQDSKASQVNS